ncbi:hypothetical protein HS088_TW08G00443 [Tripterygium wilfordii]|uniref:Prolamin-like domain-containing protein n=1 Tax=Tripterygium wilfordii TaxID=458696 RepID=A0A7J7DBU3_TRIWF|nr:hypothetical protein HS088_TW08G00443 [Tripterygium wilfordii]
MARLNLISTLIVFFMVMISGSMKMAIGQQTRYEMIIANCRRRIPIEEGQQIFDYIFKNKGVPSLEACDKLVQGGQACHGVLIRDTLKNPLFKGLEAEANKRGAEIWDKCAENGVAASGNCVPKNYI